MLPNNACPACGRRVDDATAVDLGDHQPKPGDVSVCVYCSAMLVFHADLTVHLMTRAEILALGRQQPETARMLTATVIAVQDKIRERAKFN